METSTLSMIEGSSRNIGCSFEIQLGRTIFNLLASTLDTILYGTMHTEIGLKSTHRMRVVNFGNQGYVGVI